jgi:hypothetical protein
MCTPALGSEVVPRSVLAKWTAQRLAHQRSARYLCANDGWANVGCPPVSIGELPIEGLH